MSRREIAALVLGALAGALVFGLPRTFAVSPDASEYLEFSGAILDGSLFTLRGAEITRGLATRTPGYPLGLAALRALGLGPEDALRALHALAGLAALVLVPLLLRRFVPVALASAGVLVALLVMHRFYSMPISEWLAVNLVLVLFALGVRLVERASPGRLAAVGLTASAAVLTRPALIPALLFPLALAFFGQRKKLRALSVALLSLAPVFLWMGFNGWRLGRFTLTPFTGSSLFGLACLAGHASPRAGDDPELARFIEEVNRAKAPPPGVRFDGLRAVANYNKNVHEVAEPIALARGYERVAFDRMMLTYGLRAIAAYPGEYARLVARGLRVPLTDLALLSLPILVLPGVWLARGRRRGVAVLALAFAGLHLAHLSICATIELVIPRYRSLTLAPLLGIALVASGVFLIDVVRARRRRGDPQPEAAPRRGPGDSGA